MTVSSAVFTIGPAVPVLIATGPISVAVIGGSGDYLAPQVYLGPDNVTAGMGFPLRAAQPFYYRLSVGEKLYAIANGGNVDIHTLFFGAVIGSADGVLIPQGVYTGETVSAIYDTQSFSSAIMFLTVTVTAAGNLAIHLDVQESGTNTWVPYCEWLNITAVAGTVMAVVDTDANQGDYDAKAVVKNVRLPHVIRVRVTPSNISVPWTYSLSVTVLR